MSIYSLATVNDYLANDSAVAAVRSGKRGEGGQHKEIGRLQAVPAEERAANEQDAELEAVAGPEHEHTVSVAAATAAAQETAEYEARRRQFIRNSRR